MGHRFQGETSSISCERDLIISIQITSITLSWENDVLLQSIGNGRVELFRLKPYSRKEPGLVSIR